MRERIILLKQEVEQRGFLWEDEKNGIKPGVNGHTDDAHETSEQARVDVRQDADRRGGSISDQELAL